MLGQAAGGEAVILSYEPNVYQRVQEQQIELLLAHRSGATERALLVRMMAAHELRRRQVSENLEPLQLDLLGEHP
jgi:hypothetical protein